VIKKQRREHALHRQAVQQSELGGVPSFEPETSTLDPARLALWTELQQTVAALSPHEREVFLLHGMGDCTQAEIARMMNVPPYKVSRLWLSACEKLGDIVEAIRDRA
jgi:RNA polymerase sigma factor (sigma-70 family)